MASPSKKRESVIDQKYRPRLPIPRKFGAHNNPYLKPVIEIMGQDMQYNDFLFLRGRSRLDSQDSLAILVRGVEPAEKVVACLKVNKRTVAARKWKQFGPINKVPHPYYLNINQMFTADMDNGDVMIVVDPQIMDGVVVLAKGSAVCSRVAGVFAVNKKNLCMKDFHERGDVYDIFG